MQHGLPLVPKEEIQSRIERLQKVLKAKEVELALLTQNVDIYYFSGTMQNGLMVVPADGEPCFYVKKSVTRAEFESSVQVEPLPRSKELAGKLQAQFGNVSKLGMELDVIPYSQALRYAKWFPEAELVDISYEIRKLRAVKSAYELEQIQKAASTIDEVFRSLPKWITSGMREIDLVAKIENLLRLRGSTHIYRTRGYNQELHLGVVASGWAAAVPSFFDGPAAGLGLTVASPQSASWKPIQPNEPILVDLSTSVEGYIVDQTRIAVIGELDEDLKEAYEVARSILREVEPMGKPGASWESLYLKSLEMVKEAGLTDHYMGYKPDQARFLGHGVGLEFDELPVLAKGFSEPLEEGMVIAIEPKFTFPGRGVVGIENTYVVTKEGLRPISVTPEEIIRL